MKIVIIGATGKTGMLLTKQAIKGGHEVTAYVRNPDKLNLKDKNSNSFKGDTKDAKVLTKALKGKDAVALAIGLSMKEMNQNLIKLHILKGGFWHMDTLSSIDCIHLLRH